MENTANNSVKSDTDNEKTDTNGFKKIANSKILFLVDLCIKATSEEEVKQILRDRGLLACQTRIQNTGNIYADNEGEEVKPLKSEMDLFGVMG